MKEIYDFLKACPCYFIATKVALANHAWDEPRENEHKAAEVSGIPLITCCIGEIVTL